MYMYTTNPHERLASNGRVVEQPLSACQPKVIYNHLQINLNHLLNEHAVAARPLLPKRSWELVVYRFFY